MCHTEKTALIWIDKANKEVRRLKDYWQKKWETGDTLFHQDRPHPQLLKHFRSAAGKVMVPLCGKSLDLLWLKEQGNEVVGIELSPIACEAFFKENGLLFEVRKSGTFTIYQGDQISIWCGDFFQTPSDVWLGVTCVYDRAALIALLPDLRKQYADCILRNWKAKGSTAVQILLITVEYPIEAIQGPPFSVTEAEVRDLYGKVFRIDKLETRIDPALSGRHPKFENTQVSESVYRMSPA